MTTTETICSTILICWGSLIFTLLYALLLVKTTLKKYKNVNVSVEKKIGVVVE